MYMLKTSQTGEDCPWQGLVCVDRTTGLILRENSHWRFIGRGEGQEHELLWWQAYLSNTALLEDYSKPWQCSIDSPGLPIVCFDPFKAPLYEYLLAAWHVHTRTCKTFPASRISSSLRSKPFECRRAETARCKQGAMRTFIFLDCRRVFIFLDCCRVYHQISFQKRMESCPSFNFVAIA